MDTYTKQGWKKIAAYWNNGVHVKRETMLKQNVLNMVTAQVIIVCITPPVLPWVLKFKNKKSNSALIWSSHIRKILKQFRSTLVCIYTSPAHFCFQFHRMILSLLRYLCPTCHISSLACPLDLPPTHPDEWS